MNTICLLPPHEAQKIAAGEVVERPANMLKELIENSLDAGATDITMILHDGGKQALEIIDNGCGMSPEDVRLCVLPHATSKITSIDELETITTFGFRGEALASIAAISNLTIISKPRDAETALEYTNHYGTVAHEQAIAAPQGTHIKALDLFENVPARKKFLKHKDTEWRHCYQLVQAYALSNHQRTFTLMHEGQTSLDCKPAPQFIDRARDVFGPTLSHALIEHTYTDTLHNITVTGVCTDQQAHRYDRSLIFCFVNGRWIKNSKLGSALLRAYNGSLPKDKFPAGAVFITCPPHEVDVNIHPRKEEVLFLHPRVIERTVEQWARQALEKQVGTLIAPQVPSREPFTFAHSYQHHQPLQHSYAPKTHHPVVERSLEPISQAAPALEQIHAPEQQQALVQHDYKLLGQLHTTYLLLEQDDGLVLIDQHAAHERILYEKFADRARNEASITLLFPPIITVSEQDSALLEKHRVALHEYHIILEQNTRTSWLLKAVPLMLKNQAGEELIRKIIMLLAEDQADTTNSTITHALRAMMACKAAVKAGDELSPAAQQELIATLFTTPNRMTCPHGRPTTRRLTLTELERLFKRTT